MIQVRQIFQFPDDEVVILVEVVALTKTCETEIHLEISGLSCR